MASVGSTVFNLTGQRIKPKSPVPIVIIGTVLVLFRLELSTNQIFCLGASLVPRTCPGGQVWQHCRRECRLTCDDVSATRSALWQICIRSKWSGKIMRLLYPKKLPSYVKKQTKPKRSGISSKCSKNFTKFCSQVQKRD